VRKEMKDTKILGSVPSLGTKSAPKWKGFIEIIVTCAYYSLYGLIRSDIV
jgi:hypothetical protein